MALNNVLMDLLNGTNMKTLIETMTGRDMKNVKSFDGLTNQQKITRMEWIVKELQSCKLIPEDVYVDTRMVAMRGADHVFDFLWRLVSHDIWFVWERAEFLQHDDEILVGLPFKWTPDASPTKKKKRTKSKQSLLSGFGSASVVTEEVPGQTTPEPVSYDPFPGSDIMKQWKAKRPKHFPPAEDCILEMVNTHLKMNKDGRKIHCLNIDDLVDSRILCMLVNSFVPNTFTPEVLLNDRWTINLCLRTADKMFYGSGGLDSEDLAEGDVTSVCAYFCYFFMVGYKFRQCKAVVNRIAWLERLICECNHDLEHLPQMAANMQDLKRKKDIKQKIQEHTESIERISQSFDVSYSQQWVEHTVKVQKESIESIRQRIATRFESLEVPRNITINDLCLSLVVNLSLTQGVAFTLMEGKESINESRKIVLRHKESGEYFDDFTAGPKKKDKDAPPDVRKMLHLSPLDSVEINPEKYTQYDIFLDATSRNKKLQTGSEFLYQIFPGNTIQWHKQLISAVKNNEFDTVKKMILFFSYNPAFINQREATTGNSALHWGCRSGVYDIVQFLLENGANSDSRNAQKNTPLFCTIEGVHRKIAHLLVEWGCDVHRRNNKGITAFETVKNEELKEYLVDSYEHYSTIVPKIMEGDSALLEEVVTDHVTGVRVFNNLRSRCINGSTLIHTASYFGYVPVLKQLLMLRVDVNLRDYKGASPLHRAKDVDTMQILLEYSASVNGSDSEGNSPLHVKCYGETGKESELECIDLLINSGSNVLSRNNRGLMPIHCCAMQGRMDAIEMVLKADQHGSIRSTLDQEDPKIPPSLVHLAVANDFMDCADWLLQCDFKFKDGEQDLLVQRILAEQVKVANQIDAVKFLLDHGASANLRYPGGNTALHYAASNTTSTDVLELVLENGADINAMNDDQCTPLFFAAQSNNMTGASLLIEAGANYRSKNVQGLTAFDMIVDFDDWIDCGYFNDEIKARLKAYSLKHARDLVRAISKKVKGKQTNPFLRGNNQNNVLIRQSSKPSITVPKMEVYSPTASRAFSAHSIHNRGGGITDINSRNEPTPVGMLPPLKSSNTAAA